MCDESAELHPKYLLPDVAVVRATRSSVARVSKWSWFGEADAGEYTDIWSTSDRDVQITSKSSCEELLILALAGRRVEAAGNMPQTSMKRVAIIQARMTSTRLPGKVLMELDGKPMLSHLIDRVKRCRSIDEIVVATTRNGADQPVVDLAGREQVCWYRGDEADVLSRFVEAASENEADLVVRLTADCPLIDPDIVDAIVVALEAEAHLYDYASNVVERTFPRGLDTEAMFYDTLLRTSRTAQTAATREHVTALIYRERPELFRVLSVRDTEDNSDLSWTVDTETDLVSVGRLCSDLSLGSEFKPYPQILRHARQKRVQESDNGPTPSASII